MSLALAITISSLQFVTDHFLPQGLSISVYLSISLALSLKVSLSLYLRIPLSQNLFISESLSLPLSYTKKQN